MHDKYYIDLARSALSAAQQNLLQAQEYLRDAGMYDEQTYTQAIINKVRKQTDRIVKYQK